MGRTAQTNRVEQVAHTIARHVVGGVAETACDEPTITSVMATLRTDWYAARR